VAESMKRMLQGLAVTALIWAALIGAYAGIELVRGHQPFAMVQWELGGKYLTIVILFVLGLGAAIGYASDQIQRRGAGR
jgi:hypothetical protein